MYIYYNINPKGETTGDCVIRALALALNTDYYDILDKLYKTSNYFNCDMLVRNCYGKLLQEMGYKMYYGNGTTVQELAEIFYDKKLLLRINEHLTCSLYANVYDIWDTSNEIVDVFWVIE